MIVDFVLYVLFLSIGFVLGFWFSLHKLRPWVESKLDYECSSMWHGVFYIKRRRMENFKAARQRIIDAIDEGIRELE